MAFTPKEIIYNTPHPSIQLYIEDSAVKKTLIMFIQELKGDSILNIMKADINREMPLIRVQAQDKR